MNERHCKTCACGCTCGFGGEHVEDNPRCALTAKSGNDVCEHQNANYMRMMSERDALRAEVERLRDALVSTLSATADRIEAEERRRDEARQQLADLRAGIERIAAEWERHAPDRIVGQAVAADLRALPAGSGEQPGECPECGDVMCRCGIDWTAPVVPDSADMRERVRRALAGAVVDSEPVNAYASRPIAFGEGASGSLLDDLTDAVLAVVGQGVTAEQPGCCQGWEWTPSGVVDALSGVERFDQEPCKHNHSAVVRPSGKEGS